jgi:hypothetical protein
VRWLLPYKPISPNYDGFGKVLMAHCERPNDPWNSGIDAGVGLGGDFARETVSTLN